MRAKTSLGKAKPKTSPASKRTRAKSSREAKSLREAKSSRETKSSREKVRAYRERMRAKGLRLIQMWLPDTRNAAFAADARDQSLLAKNSPFAAEDQAWVDSMSDWKSD